MWNEEYGGQMWWSQWNGTLANGVGSEPTEVVVGAKGVGRRWLTKQMARTSKSMRIAIGKAAIVSRRNTYESAVS